jgi:hypothetical protein
MTERESTVVADAGRQLEIAVGAERQELAGAVGPARHLRQHLGERRADALVAEDALLLQQDRQLVERVLDRLG